jgi:dTDP-4-dehydrorhamnose reductase
LKILIIGKSGQVARSLALRLQNSELESVFIGRPEFDLMHLDQIATKIIDIKPNFIINAAAYTAVDNAQTEVETAYRINSDAPKEMAIAARFLEIPLIHISTDYVFDGKSELPYSEVDVTNPLNIYGASKLSGETAIANTWHKSIILRTSWVYSPFGNNFVKTMLRLGHERDTLNIVCDQIGSPTYAIDIAEAILKIIGELQKGDMQQKYGIFNLANNGVASWAEFAKEIFKLSKIDVKVNEIPNSEYSTSALRPLNSRLDCSKIDKAYSIALPYWKKSLADCLEKIKKYKEK